MSQFPVPELDSTVMNNVRGSWWNRKYCSELWEMLWSQLKMFDRLASFGGITPTIASLLSKQIPPLKKFPHIFSGLSRGLAWVMIFEFPFPWTDKEASVSCEPVLTETGLYQERLCSRLIRCVITIRQHSFVQSHWLIPWYCLIQYTPSET